MKTSELIGPTLNWAVAQCEGLLCFGYCSYGDRFSVKDSDGVIETYAPSFVWSQGGEIIERERIELSAYSGCWEARYWDGWENALQGLRPDVAAATLRARKIPLSVARVGPTPLIAAMRAYVASKLGEEIEVPDELK